MQNLEFIAPCHFGLEAVLKREITDLGYEIISVEDGRITFRGDQAALARANIFIRTAERMMIKVGSFKAETFDELFEGTKALSWENYLPPDAKFWVTKAATNKSKLFSSSDIQSIVKKAVVDRLKGIYHINWFEEDGAEYPIRIFILKDMVTVALDASGVSLHKRGYRTLVGKAPISETLAAALIMLTPWNKERLLIDPFCGSGTFPIEAAMIGANIAPGIHREFTAEKWSNIAQGKLWRDAVEEAEDSVIRDIQMTIQGYDIDSGIVKCAMQNAREAGVEQHIHFQQRDVRDLSSPKKYGFIITNPPYGERLEDKADIPKLYRDIGKAFDKLDTWSKFIITSYEDAERYLGRKATKNRKIYNGMIKSYFYQYMGPKPPKNRKNAAESGGKDS
ncbi:MAG: class I SAM-dependent RNA methyltransferase [Bacteroidales bacterium]|nr:class I SAM-dependent RNA methyltransferase [Clostridium sp.]MCM1204775.1 class I SAM-dependent RNA methyltransferase [Bacteroidales bacterium]